MDVICPICLEDNTEYDESDEICKICIENNCKIHNDCKKYLKDINYDYEGCYVCNSNFFNREFNNNDFVQIGDSKIYLINNKSLDLSKYNNEEIELPSLSNNSSNTDIPIDNNNHNIAHKIQKVNKYNCINILYNLFILFLFIFLIFCISILFYFFS